MTKTIFGLATNKEQARRTVDRLIAAGFPNQAISLLYPDQDKNQAKNSACCPSSETKKGCFTTEKNSKAPEGAAVGAATGGVLGGSLGLLAGIGALSIPGLGAFIAAGPIMAALGGSAVGGSVGLLIGALVGSGIPEYEAKKYEAGLKAGNILLSVDTDKEEEVKRAQEILQKEGLKEISSTSEQSVRR